MNTLDDQGMRAQYWQSVEQEALALPYCSDCKKFFFFPRPFCPHCWSSEVGFRPASGKGKVWTYTVVRFALGGNAGWKTRVPYVLALVELEEGVRLMGNVVDCPPETVCTGLDVTVAYREFDGRKLPVFIPA